MSWPWLGLEGAFPITLFCALVYICKVSVVFNPTGPHPLRVSAWFLGRPLGCVTLWTELLALRPWAVFSSPLWRTHPTAPHHVPTPGSWGPTGTCLLLTVVWVLLRWWRGEMIKDHLGQKHTHSELVQLPDAEPGCFERKPWSMSARLPWDLL